MREKKMKKFCVLVERTYVHRASIDIEATSEKEARRKALNMIDNTKLKLDRMADIDDYADVEYEYKEGE